jgi:dipeptidyl aminopeptidase/acylaminoacyl peptidase
VRRADGRRQVADELDFVARAGERTARPPLLLVSGEEDHPVLRTDAAALVDALRERYGRPDEVADELDFVARAGDVTGEPPVLLVSGERDHPELRTDAAALVDALRARYARPEDVEMVTVPDLAHPLADEPGLEPAPQLPTAGAVDEIVTRWFGRQLRS